jgi:hypothetical protein
MQNLNGWIRLAILGSVVWMIANFLYYDCFTWWTTRAGRHWGCNFYDVGGRSMLPLIIFWGIYWAWLGFKSMTRGK